ncbi:unnamed protein product, partial [Urochloa humidicola]
APRLALSPPLPTFTPPRLSPPIPPPRHPRLSPPSPPPRRPRLSPPPPGAMAGSLWCGGGISEASGAHDPIAERPSWLPSPYAARQLFTWHRVRTPKAKTLLGSASLAATAAGDEGHRGHARPGRSLPLSTVAVKPKRRSSKVAQMPPQPEARIPGTQTIYVKTFGCSHNQSDSEYMSGQLSAFGYAINEEPEGADLWLIITDMIFYTGCSSLSN